MIPPLSLPTQVNLLLPRNIKSTHPSRQNHHELLRNCIRTKNLTLGRRIHSLLLESNRPLDVVAANSLISLYSKCCRPDLALSLFDEMRHRGNLVTWTALLSCFSNNQMEKQALALFLDLLDSGFSPNEFTFSAVIQACTRGKLVEEFGVAVLGFATKTGFAGRDPSVGSALIDMFAETRAFVSAKKVFDGMTERNVVVWTLMITRYAQNGFEKDAIDLFLKMGFDGFEPDRFTVSSVISACTGTGSLGLGRQLHCMAVKIGMVSDACVGCSLVDMYAKCGLGGTIDESRKVFEQMIERNVMAWTAVISGYVQNGGHDNEAVKLFVEMIHGRVQPNHFTYSSVLKACTNLSDAELGEQVYARVVKSGLSSVNFVGNSLVSMYTRSGRMEEARKAFDVLFDKNLVSYNAIMDGYVKNSNSEEVFGLFREIDSKDVGVSAFTFASLLSAAASLGVMGKGQQLHAQLIKAGFELDRAISNALVSMYSKCGNIEDASRVFNEIGDRRNVITWTSMITGFAKHGHADLALESFNEMVSIGIKPNEVTYIAVLSACSHVGLVQQGKKHFETMQTVHRIVPRMEHFACMVDLLTRSGLLEEAFEFITSMPLRADALVWRTLLAACRLHRNVELGEIAAKQILQLEPDDPAAYVLLSNLYALTGKWEEVAKVRKGMKEKRVSKEAGLSWVEIGNTVHKFHAGDTSHPRASKIFEKLDELVEKIKGMGYVVDTSSVLHDIEDALKEQYLLQHSEKIAVAFGLISTSAPATIRVFKNLRVCGDCHNAIKFISKASGRDIIVRDSNRFHRFSNGECSCGEYW